jgi:hypothetical protein
VKGVGTFDNVNFTGTFSPGLSPTSLQVGNVALTNSSTLAMELGGTAPGSGYDQILSSGALVLDGVLQVSLIGGFSPNAGQSFNLFDWASVSGVFDALSLPALAGLAWDTSQLYSDGILSLAAAGLAGDYNSNGIVDAADYTVWRDNVGAPAGSLANDTTGAVIGADQYNQWRANYGATSAGLGVAVPEPGAALLLMMIIGACGAPGRRRVYSDRTA